MSVDTATVKKVANLARIAISDADAERLAPELNNILGFIEQLGEVDTKDVAPMTAVIPNTLRLRPDVITDGNQRVQEVRGLGVVGQQPLLAPGETFEYTSGCPLPTPVGTMRGTYHCVGENGIPFEVPISEFVLAMPRTLH